MSTVWRGVRGVFRNTIRTGGVTIILALSIGLALVMLLALKTVQSRIDSVKASVGNTISISPAGFSNFSDANNALTTTQLAKVQAVPHVTKLTEELTDRLPTTGQSLPSFGRMQSSDSSGSTISLSSPVKLNAGGNGQGGGGGRLFIRGGGQLPANFSLPVSIVGTTDPATLNGSTLKITSGTVIDGSKDTNTALVSTDMATKNNLKVGSTFQVKVDLAGGKDVYAVPLQLQYDQTKLSLINVDLGDSQNSGGTNFLGKDGQTVALVHRDDGAGNVSVVASRPPGAKGVDGGGTVCVLTFKATAAGPAAVVITKPVVRNSAQQAETATGSRSIIQVQP